MTPEPDGIGSLIVFAFLSLITFSIGRKRGFFDFPTLEKTSELPIRWVHVVSVFAIYFGISYLVTPVLGKILHYFLLSSASSSSFLKYASWVNFSNSGLILLSLIFFSLMVPDPIRSKIWIFREENRHKYIEDIRFAGLAWLISFPLVLFVNQLFDWIVSNLFHIKHIPEQLAVYFLKLNFGHPFYLLLAISTIVVFAPLIEETLFRGFLQSYFRKHLGSKQAVLITSFLFSFFHYSPEQGIANLTIIASLFVFSLFLGFIYEKRGSLLCPITLHALFNAVNVGNLYFFGGTSDNAGFVAFFNFFANIASS